MSLYNVPKPINAFSVIIYHRSCQTKTCHKYLFLWPFQNSLTSVFKHRYHAINHKGNYLGTLLDKFGWTKTNLRERDLNLRPTDWRGLYQLSYLAIHWRSPYFVNIFVRGGASQKLWNHILPFSQGSRPGYDTTWEEAVNYKLLYTTATYIYTIQRYLTKRIAQYKNNFNCA